MNTHFEEFFIDKYPKVKSFALRILLYEEDAEDAAQDIFMKLLELPEIWSENEPEDKLLFVIVRNHLFNIIKRKVVERKYQQSLDLKNFGIDDIDLENNLHAKELEIIAMNIIEQMPEQRQKIFKMSRFEGKSVTEISEILNISKRTVERHIYLALAELKKILLFFIF